MTMMGMHIQFPVNRPITSDYSSFLSLVDQDEYGDDRSW
jgi:hypothetical protein